MIFVNDQNSKDFPRKTLAQIGHANTMGPSLFRNRIGIYSGFTYIQLFKILKLVKYYSPTVADGKTFVLVF